MSTSSESIDVTDADDWQIAERPVTWKARQAKLYVSLNKRGEFVMNEAAFIAIRRPASVALLYNKDSKKIAIKFPVKEDRFFFNVRRCGRDGQNRIINAARMLKQFELETTETIVFSSVKAELVRNDPALVLTLETKKKATGPAQTKPAAI